MNNDNQNTTIEWVNQSISLAIVSNMQRRHKTLARTIANFATVVKDFLTTANWSQTVTGYHFVPFWNILSITGKNIKFQMNIN